MIDLFSNLVQRSFGSAAVPKPIHPLYRGAASGIYDVERLNLSELERPQTEASVSQPAQPHDLIPRIAEVALESTTHSASEPSSRGLVVNGLADVRESTVDSVADHGHLERAGPRAGSDRPSQSIRCDAESPVDGVATAHVAPSRSEGTEQAGDGPKRTASLPIDLAIGSDATGKERISSRQFGVRDASIPPEERATLDSQHDESRGLKFDETVVSVIPRAVAAKSLTEALAIRDAAAHRGLVPRRGPPPASDRRRAVAETGTSPDAASAERHVTVTIGRLEVRVAPAPSATRGQSTTTQQAGNELDEYLRTRQQGGSR